MSIADGTGKEVDLTFELEGGLVFKGRGVITRKTPELPPGWTWTDTDLGRCARHTSGICVTANCMWHEDDGEAVGLGTLDTVLRTIREKETVYPG